MEGLPTVVEFVDGNAGREIFDFQIRQLCTVSEKSIGNHCKTRAGVPAYITEAFMRTGSYDCQASIRTSHKNCLKSYAEEIYGIIQANHYNLDLTKMVFMGGSSSIVEHLEPMRGKNVQL